MIILKMMPLFHEKHERETKITLQIVPNDSSSENKVSCQYGA